MNSTDINAVAPVAPVADINPIVEPETSPDTCPICFEILTQNKNFCSTPCGHVFCFSCIAKHMTIGSNTCPCCRGEINEKKSDTDEEDTEYSDIEFSDDDDFETDDELENENDIIDDDDDEEIFSNIESIETHLKNNNISYLDILSTLINRFPKNNTRLMNKRIQKQLFNLINELDEENSINKRETRNMTLEDIRYDN